MVSGTFANELELLLAFRAKDPKAISQVFHQYYCLLVDYGTQLINNAPEAEDIAISAFLKLLDKAGNFENLNNVRAFLFVAVRNSCLNYLDKVKVRARYENEAAFLSRQEEQNQYDLVQMDAAIINTLYEEINNLPGQCREIFKLHFLKNSNSKEIAEHLGLSVQTVRNQITRARNFLRTALYKKQIISGSTLWVLLHLTFVFA